MKIDFSRVMMVFEFLQQNRKIPSLVIDMLTYFLKLSDQNVYVVQFIMQINANNLHSGKCALRPHSNLIKVLLYIVGMRETTASQIPFLPAAMLNGRSWLNLANYPTLFDCAFRNYLEKTAAIFVGKRAKVNVYTEHISGSAFLK